MTHVCNLISLLRVPLAFLLLSPLASLRLCAIILAMLTDIFDGYLARKLNATSRVGAVLDPLTDKFFALFALGIFLYEGKIASLEAMAFLSRDLFLVAFAGYLTLSGNWGRQRILSLTWGKVSTACQLIVLMTLALGFRLPSLSYSVFVAFGALAFRDFYVHLQKQKLEGSP